MPHDLLLAALAQAERSDRSVKGIALLHIARVMAVDDLPRARQLMEEGIAVISNLPEKQRSILFGEAAPLAGTVSPQRAFDLIQQEEPAIMPWRLDRIIFDLLSHGHVKEAIDYLSAPGKEYGYPYMGASQAMANCRQDPAAQLRILRGALTAIQSDSSRPFENSEFLELFKHYWRILPIEETATAVRKLVERFLQQPDQRGDMNSGTAAGSVHFSSTQQWRLFEIFVPLRRVAPDLAESLVLRFSELAEAAKKYPDGYDLWQEVAAAAEPVDENAPKCGVDIDWDDVNFTWIPVSEWVERILPQKIDKALELYRYDTTPDPNTAPRECWPSTQALRSVLYQAGRYQGTAAMKHLERIPDPDVRLLVQIELCAALAGLSQVGGGSIPRQNGDRERRPEPLPMVTAESLEWKGHGSPHQVQVETAEWIAEKQTWATSDLTFSAVYRQDGQAERVQRRNPDGSHTQCEFDYGEDGKPTACSTMLDSGEVEKTGYSYDDSAHSIRIAKVTNVPEHLDSESVTGDGFIVSTSRGGWVSFNIAGDSYEIADATELLTQYDSNNRPVEVSYFGPDRQLMARKTLRWDSEGRLGGDKLILAFGDLVGATTCPISRRRIVTIPKPAQVSGGGVWARISKYGQRLLMTIMGMSSNSSMQENPRRG